MADNLPQFFTENEFIYKDDLSITKGKHNFKGGARILVVPATAAASIR